MKNLFLMLSVLLIFSCSTSQEEIDDNSDTDNSELNSSQTRINNLSEGEKILEIREEFQKIESSVNTYKIKEWKYNVSEYEDEVYDVKAYYDGEELKKMILEFAFGHGGESTEYFLKDNKVFFVFGQQAYESSAIGPYTYRQFRTYIYDDKMIRVLKKEKTVEGDATVDMDKLLNNDITGEVEKSWKDDLIKEYQLALDNMK